ncbi:translation initiation factor 3, RNA-binding subunit [Nadsonia fulvescens var. elongata DSM 6958]|uniref:Eukaryotic translation initiation factor 3 subunit G n=1 Tax=Nadsonia fulvescens var. elongata DSM 6958 TaxID=857566 RepID=A0A1E3PIQ2_9ASCO|nr:translation initiation factor 3, RNA-binding subunit [Nadsonia fulvescens var. elongata DSM 6958]
MSADIAIGKSTWADEMEEDEGLLAPVVTTNRDGTKTVVSYRIDPDTQKKIKVTQKIREVVVKERVNAAVAERKSWAKYGREKDCPPGPNLITTSVGENMLFRLALKSKVREEDEEKAEAKKVVKDKKITCRICGGEHFTSKCPYKDALGPADATAAEAEASRQGSPAPAAGGSYVPPHLRNGGSAAAGGSGAPSENPDESPALRISNLSEEANEQDLRELFGGFGPLERVHVVKDRETGRPRGFAFVTFMSRMSAERAKKVMDGHGFDNLIMSVDFAKR